MKRREVEMQIYTNLLCKHRLLAFFVRGQFSGRK